MIKFDRYDLEGRVLPAVLASVPFFVLYFFFLKIHVAEFFQFLFGLKWVGDVSTGVVFLFLLVFIGRAVAKDIFESRWFKSDETRMPSTAFLLHSDREYSRSFKLQIHQKIKQDFQIELFSADEENRDEGEARRVIAEAVSLIRHRLQGGRLLLNRNIEYGFIRNLIGCSVVAALISFVNIYVYGFLEFNKAALCSSIATAVLYVLPILLSKQLMHHHGRRYAKTLLQEYIGAR